MSTEKYQDYDVGIPSGGNYIDVKAIFVEGVEGIAPDELVFSDGLTLHDSMSAFEIGEPRMDSGMVVGEADAPPFDPLAPLLPEEVCWIMDRMIACEMAWHAGNSLPQTIFTLLYMHELSEINPDNIGEDWFDVDPTRPLELITIVLRAAVFGYLKTCDLTWRELSKKRVFELEDWQSEKCDVSLFEGIPVAVVVQKLEEALEWLQYDADIPSEQRDALIDRILLRKHMLELFNLNAMDNLDSIQLYLGAVHESLGRVQNQPSRTPNTDSPALLAFDPMVTRQLTTVMPIRALELPDQTAVWQSMERLLQDWGTLDQLRFNHSINVWEETGSFLAWLPRTKIPLPYIRSVTQNAFYDRDGVLGEHPSEWLVEQFFSEALGVSYESISELLVTSWAGGDALSLSEFEDTVITLISGHICSFWLNPPRRRRHLMKSILDWQALHDATLALQNLVVVSTPRNVMIMQALPELVNHWKLGVAREIILSGFQQDLYASHERPIAYWLAAQILDQHLVSLDRLQSFPFIARVPWTWRAQFLSALQMMCIAMCLLTSFNLPPTASTMASSFRRRYKWLMASWQGETSSPLFNIPPLSRYPEDIKDIVKSDKLAARHHLEIAQDILENMTSSYSTSTNHPQDESLNAKFFRLLARVNARLLQAVIDQPDAEVLAKRFRWDSTYHPWFPDITAAS